MSDFLMKSDARIQEDVQNELRWDPRVTATQISVGVKDGIVTLRGSVPHYFEKNVAEKSTQRVHGVRAIVDEMEVNLLGSYERTDEDIARGVLFALEGAYLLSKKPTVKVEKGWVTLEGEVEGEYQRRSAADAIRPVMGVRGVSNNINLSPLVNCAEVKSRIEEALKRSAKNEGKKITVSVDGNEITLSGEVHTFWESAEASLAAWNAPGVANVKNLLTLPA